MWNSSQSGGGFMNDTNTNTPSKGASGGSGKNKKQNIVPVNIIQSLSFSTCTDSYIVFVKVLINEVLTAPEEGFKVEETDVRTQPISA